LKQARGKGINEYNNGLLIRNRDTKMEQGLEKTRDKDKNRPEKRTRYR
jgi:hypothetical protein